jgi:hypothetical protein
MTMPELRTCCRRRDSCLIMMNLLFLAIIGTCLTKVDMAGTGVRGCRRICNTSVSRPWRGAKIPHVGLRSDHAVVVSPFFALLSFCYSTTSNTPCPDVLQYGTDDTPTAELKGSRTRCVMAHCVFVTRRRFFATGSLSMQTSASPFVLGRAWLLSTCFVKCLLSLFTFAIRICLPFSGRCWRRWRRR